MESITAKCACRAFSFQADFPKASIPFQRALCLCTICRSLSGGCGVSYIALPSIQVNPLMYNLTSYSTSDRITRYFCSTCGAHCFVQWMPTASWHLATGLWDRTEGIIKWTGCKWVNDTLDGGISVWLKEIANQDGSKRELRRWMLQDGDNELVPEGILTSLSEKLAKDESNLTLKAHCCCGGVKFSLTRPTEASKAARSPFPDLMVPYHSDSPANPENTTWWLREHNTKYLAGTCACTSCRESSGFDIQPWAFVPRCNILQEDGKPLDFSSGTLKRYESSSGVHREFCGRCGATVFWHCDERPDIIDVSVGLFDSSQGARVESWLDWWTDRVSFSEMAVSTSLIASLENGLKAWK